MLCIRPFRPRPGVEHGCGQCKACRVNRRRIWVARMVLESLAYPMSAFLTLTYEDRFLPLDGVSSVHAREFTKELGFRYFLVGEYGDRTSRPHYHAIVYGLDVWDSASLARVSARWPYGFVQIGMASAQSMEYCAGYTLKKMTKVSDERLEGRNPEFARMSRRPALGWPGVDYMVKWFASPEGQAYIARERDVPSSLRVQGKLYPLGTTIKRKLRELLDIPSDDPIRRDWREQAQKVVDMDPILSADRERRRHGNYDVLAVRMMRGRGVL